MASNAFMSSVKELQLGYSSTNAKLSNKAQYPYFMRVIAPDSLQSMALVQVLREFGYNQVTCMHSDDAYAEGLALDFRTFAKEDGIVVSMFSLPYGLYEAWPGIMARLGFTIEQDTWYGILSHLVAIEPPTTSNPLDTRFAA